MEKLELDFAKWWHEREADLTKEQAAAETKLREEKERERKEKEEKEGNERKATEEEEVKRKEETERKQKPVSRISVRSLLRDRGCCDCRLSVMGSIITRLPLVVTRVELLPSCCYEKQGSRSI